ncbi:MAG: single-stranded DNA-binding protein [Oscillospiraceae bacterium]|jgi:single-strand DNA-binding protein|nr:single-stranded DNA-binding protein [Oscillospiraceae bacterium]
MLNKAILMGRITADPELKHTPNNVSVVSFSLAVNRTFTTKGGERQTDFIDVVAWRQTADFVGKYFRKGQLMAVEGSIQTRTYEDKNGNKRKAVEIVADQVHFAESKGSGANQSDSPFSAPAFEEPPKGSSFSIGDFGEFEEVDTDDGELPF